MDHVFAISLQDQVEKYGAYVGIAAFFGLAVLTVLYFAQAREVKRLREWAGHEPERAREATAAGPAATTAQPASGVRAQPVGSGVTAPAEAVAATSARTGAGSTSGAAAAAAAGAASVHTDADADAEATSTTALPVAATAAGAGSVAATAIPTGGSGPGDREGVGDGSAEGRVSEPEEAEARTDAESSADIPGEPGAVPAGDDAQAARAQDGAEPGTAEAPSVPPPEDRPEPEVVSPAPVVASTGSDPAGSSSPLAPSSNGTSDSRELLPATNPVPPPRPIPARAAPLRATPAATARPSARAYGASTSGRRPGVPDSTSRTPARSGRFTAAAIGGAVVTLAALVFAGTQLFGGADPPAPRANVVAGDPTPSATTGQGAQGNGPSATATRARTQVAVFNGTTTAGLALSMAERLQSRGYPEGARTGNFTPDPAAPDQLRTTSTVYYADDQRAQARDVGRLLSISDLKPIDDNLQSLAPQAKVIVIVGADKTR